MVLVSLESLLQCGAEEAARDTLLLYSQHGRAAVDVVGETAFCGPSSSRLCVRYSDRGRNEGRTYPQTRRIVRVCTRLYNVYTRLRGVRIVELYSVQTDNRVVAAAAAAVCRLDVDRFIVDLPSFEFCVPIGVKTTAAACSTYLL